jgi:3-methyladenine DNA glycosylase/8-oxoguanine DNA glycosylase
VDLVETLVAAEMKRKPKNFIGFKAEKSIKIPRRAVTKMQAAAAAAAAAEVDQLKLDRKVHLAALKDLLAFFEQVRGVGSWTVADVKRLEEIRLLSLGI